MRRDQRMVGRAATLGALGLVGLMACSIGGEDNEPSPFDEVEIVVPTAATVADGRSEALVEVRGEVGREFTLVAVDAIFARPDSADVPTETTVFLADDGFGEGLATVALRATRAGRAAVFLKANRVASLRELTFSAIAIEVSAATLEALEPGRVRHRFCVSANAGEGRITVTGDSGGRFAPVTIELGSAVPDGLSCASGDGIVGFAEVTWSTAVGEEAATISYLGPADQVLATQVVALDGDAFPGYDMTVAPVDIANQVATVELSVLYADLGSIEAAPAEGVGLDGVRFVPSVGPTFLGSSSGGEQATPMTAADGNATLFFSLEGLSGSFTLFVTPTGGATAAVTQITVP